MHCRVTHNFVYRVIVLLYRNCDTVNNVVGNLHAVLHGTGYLTVVSAVGFDGKVMNNR